MLSPGNDGASSWWKTSKTTGTPRRAANSRTGSSGQRSSFSSTSRAAAPGLSRSKPAAKRSGGPACRTILCDSSRPNALSSRSWYSSSATAASTTSGRTEESTVYWPGCVEMLIPRINAPTSASRGANSSHHASSFAACEPNGIRFDVSRKTAMPWASFQRRIDSSASRFDAISSRSRSGVTFASRSVRADDGSCVLTQA